MAIELEPTAPAVAPKASVASALTPVYVALLIRHAPSVPYRQSSQWALTCSKDKGKAKAMEEDDDNEDEATQTLREELKNFVVPTTFSDKDLAGLLPPLMEYYEGDVGLPQGARILNGRKVS
ncbi:hypothetical protein C0995_015090 [Termitomyces sp. Mi166|nr:hypothetical protein C0995_015090 [Termitomyces sp. Mi166\